MKLYFLIIAISLALSVMSFISEITEGNITHIKNGRKPEAGAAIFPTIPFIPIILVLVAWGINQLHYNLGFYMVSGLFVIYFPFWYFSFKTSKKELNEISK